MANAGSCVAHLFKMTVTLICMRYIDSSYSIFPIGDVWAARAFQILLLHSILGVLTFGTSGGIMGKRFFRNIYNGLSNVIEIVPFALLATEISLRCYVNETLRQSLLLTLGLTPIVREVVARKKNFGNFRNITEALLVVQLFTIVIACLRRGHTSIISLVVSYILDRYFLEDLCDRFDVPYIDLAQYSLCFIEIFALLTIREL